MPKLHIFVVHTQHLRVRAMHIHGVLQNIRLAASAENFDVNIRLVLTPDASHIQEKINEMQNEVNYDPVNNPVFDQFRVLLSTEMLSNTKKHLDIWNRIAQMQDVQPDDLFLVLEDDTFTIPETIPNFRDLLKNIHSAPWDIIFLGLTTNQTDTPTIGLRELGVLTEVLPCKDSYFINQATAKRSLQDWTKHKFIMRVQWSYWLSQNPDVRACVPSKRIFLDASKMGMMPSTIHPNNILIFNREFVELSKLAALPEAELQKQYKAAESLYSLIKPMNSADVIALFGKILLKCGRLLEAKKTFLSAIDVLKLHNCPVRSASELYQNLVNMHEKMQSDLEDIVSHPSLYEDKAMALPDIQ